ncbi:complement C1q-like protein 4 [Saccostrea echinata]|uniref:complement C1q-like protein 4 n=1 Tax=Saccostrea echinata TaxID=191078 RepID=UPI002A8280C8|nr:complement C1q-like protein 4 [Saccostrea echinata]
MKITGKGIWIPILPLDPRMRFTESHREVATESSSDDIRMLQQELSSLRQEVEQLRQEVRQNPKTGSDRAFRRDETQNRILLSQERNRRLLLNSQKVTTEIAFYANRPIDYQNISVHQTLAFGNVISNVGNCYHGTSGIFTPSVSGVYVFHVQLIMCSVGHDVRTELVVEGVSKGGHYAGGSTTCANGGGSTIVHVNAGDAVWVRETTSDGKNLFGWETSFSGFLLYED